jgi:hypothetical protein
MDLVDIWYTQSLCNIFVSSEIYVTEYFVQVASDLDQIQCNRCSQKFIQVFSVLWKSAQ